MRLFFSFLLSQHCGYLKEISPGSGGKAVGGRLGEKVFQLRWSHRSIPSKLGPWAETINITSPSEFTTA